ncbi:hypothetical protein [Mucilaginibacter boryungensis]|uniref:Uncharacterized protein n=1 Tax=Mucilaginibacter boryungensis TaxID=768480 RepID=A0ABR9XNB8_9SPHI|nr:hypothetical protein [Mucilaginibacter boryungensis]MBE9668722.1 hypothetical protein [Mucilaginibacter boryungensis]
MSHSKLIPSSIKVDPKAITDWIRLGSSITGTAIATGLGAHFPGIEGAMVGSVMSPIIIETFASIGADIKQSILGDRERVRVGAAFSYALSKINQRVQNGEQPRTDGLFNGDSNERSASQEILEGALQFAQREFEELKIKHYGYLVANIYFESNIDRGYANLLLRLADKLSFRQLTMLELLANSAKFELIKRRKPLPGTELLYTLSTSNKVGFSTQAPLKSSKADLALEVEEMKQMGVIAELEFKLEFMIPSDHFVNLGLTKVGRTLRDLMELSEIDEKYILENAEWLRYIESSN